MIVYLILFFIFGLIWGSFANVCIYRIPLEKSIIKPRSYCPSCLNTISWHDNIPLLSFLMLKGKCRYCKKKISIEYPIVELITGLSFLMAGLKYHLEPILIIYLIFTFILIVISGIDFHYKIIPDIFSLSLILLGLGFSFFNPYIGDTWKIRFFNSLTGMLLGGGSFLLIGYIGEKILHKEALGGGDIKLLAGIGAVLGWQKIMSTIFIASLLGSIISIFFILTKKMDRKDYIPFGPFLAIAGYINIFLPSNIIIYIFNF